MGGTIYKPFHIRPPAQLAEISLSQRGKDMDCAISDLILVDLSRTHGYSSTTGEGNGGTVIQTGHLVFPIIPPILPSRVDIGRRHMRKAGTSCIVSGALGFISLLFRSVQATVELYPYICLHNHHQ